MYFIQPLVGPPGLAPDESSAMPFGVNEAGDVVGSVAAWLWDSSSPDPVFAIMGAIWHNATLAFTQPWNQASSLLYATNNKGVAIGVRAIENTSTTHADMVRANLVYDFKPDVGTGSFVRGINDAGLACGWSMDHAAGFVYSTDAGNVAAWITPLPGTAKLRPKAINQSGLVFGLSDYTAFVWLNGSLSSLGPAAFAGGINDAGVACGSIAKPYPQNYSPAVCNSNVVSATFAEIPVPPGFDGGHADDINNSGAIVGSCWKAGDINTNQSAFVFAGGISTDLNTQIFAAGWHLEYATGINNAGQITGYGTYQGRRVGFLLTPRRIRPGSWKIPLNLHEPQTRAPWPWPPQPEPPGPVERQDFATLRAMEALAGRIADGAARDLVQRALAQALRSERDASMQRGANAGSFGLLREGKLVLPGG